MPESLSITLLLRITVIALAAYVFAHTQAFRLMFKEQTSFKEKAVLIAVFSAISITGTYLAVPVEGALANFRDTGSIVAGLLAGPAVGTATGVISGLYRIYLGGFTDIPCGVSTMLGGMLAGYIHIRTKPRKPEWVVGAITGVGVVLFSMAFILVWSKPFSAALSLVSAVTVPMSLANAVGIAVFMLIIDNARAHQTRIAALQTHNALHIANAALPHFRQGLTAVSAENVARTILAMTSAAAVAITDREKVLAHVGMGDDHHQSGGPVLTAATKACLETARPMVAQTRAEIGCPRADCPLKSVTVVPLFCRDELVGSLKIYYAREEAMNALDIEFAQGLGQIFSTQLELANLQQKAELAAKAELKALRAQVNPHFLFNALNTIVSLCRSNPEEARRLIIELSDFFRRSLKTNRDFVTIREELEHVESYLVLEKARFGRRLKVALDIDEHTLNVMIPTFTLQPLVENAVKHGLLAKEDGGTVRIKTKIAGPGVTIEIVDDGQGIPRQVLEEVLKDGYGRSTGIGLTNVNGRLKAIYGPKHALEIESAEGLGTTVRLNIPLYREEGAA